MPNFHTLAEAFPSGVFLSNTYAGGTGNVEMELFTGIPSAFLGAGESLTGLGDTSAYRRVPSLARVFGAAGYETLFVHSYNDELYDRARNIPALGFDQIIYQDDFLVDKTYAGGYVSDDTLADELIARFEAKGDGPVFLYGLTMENHQPYFGGKFNTPAPVAASADNLSGEEAGVLDALVHGLTDADAALGKLTDYFAQAEEPTILSFWGIICRDCHWAGTIRSIPASAMRPRRIPEAGTRRSSSGCTAPTSWCGTTLGRNWRRRRR